MSTDANESNGDMVKLNVKVPKGLLEEIDELAEELEYTIHWKLDVTRSANNSGFRSLETISRSTGTNAMFKPAIGK